MNASLVRIFFCVLLAAALPAVGSACPFCSAVSQTLSQEIAGTDIAVIARLVGIAPESDDAAGLDLDDPNAGMSQFEVLEVIRGAEAPALGSTIQVVYFGSEQEQKQFLISGLAAPRIDWTTPLPLSERGVEYVKLLEGLPEEGAERLAFFLNYLEDPDPLLAQDAYDEFGRAPYEVVVGVREQMDRQKLVAWIEDPLVGPTRRRLYLTMLGICGQAEDVAVIESLLLYDYQEIKPGLAAAQTLMRQAAPLLGGTVLNKMVEADVRRKQQCLDALIAAYLKLKGPAGLPLIETKFLANRSAEYTQVYAAVMALRFHGEETDAVPRERLLKSVRLLLENSEIADQVIPDLARWEDWSVLEQLVEMFKSSEPQAWVRQPVISYLLVAEEQPGPVGTRAAAAIAELEALDPEGVKRARSYQAFGLLSRVGAAKPPVDPAAQPPAAGSASSVDKPLSPAEQSVSPTPEASSPDASLTAEDAKAAEQPAAELGEAAGPSRLLIIGGPWIACLLLMGVFALLLRGADVRP